MREEQGGAIQKSAAAEANGAAAVQWQRTLWVMVGIQFIMTGAFSVLSPMMPPLSAVSSAKRPCRPSENEFPTLVPLSLFGSRQPAISLADIPIGKMDLRCWRFIQHRGRV